MGLERQRLVLECGEDCDVVIPDPHVSRQQVALVLDAAALDKLQQHSWPGNVRELRNGED